MDSTWEQRDLPVLDAVVRYFDEHAGMSFPQVSDIAEITGRDPKEVYRALKALDGTYVELQEYLAGDNPNPHTVMAVSEEARRAVGQWPSPELWADRIIQALREAAEREPDPAKRSRLRATAEGLAGFGRDVLVGVLSGGITRGMDLS
jgi:hypothetical protein